MEELNLNLRKSQIWFKFNNPVTFVSAFCLCQWFSSFYVACLKGDRHPSVAACHKGLRYQGIVVRDSHSAAGPLSEEVLWEKLGTSIFLL